MRTELEEGLHLIAMDNYGLTEVMGPGVAGECHERSGLHVNEDHFIVEVIDPRTLRGAASRGGGGAGVHHDHQGRLPADPLPHGGFEPPAAGALPPAGGRLARIQRISAPHRRPDLLRGAEGLPLPDRGDPERGPGDHAPVPHRAGPGGGGRHDGRAGGNIGGASRLRRAEESGEAARLAGPQHRDRRWASRPRCPWWSRAPWAGRARSAGSWTAAPET